jgi:hypothetical protein
MSEEAGELKQLATRKVGPLPVIAWGGIAVVAWYVVSKRKTSAAQGATTTSATGSEPGTEGTDPAGNTGLIDPATGYVYGTPEDLAALDQQNQSSGGSSGGSGGTSTAQTYTTNSAWEVAAINYLVGLGVDPTEANSAIAAYLGSQTLSTTQQAEVNDAITALGAPPQPPSPATTTPVVNPPGSGTSATNPPTGLVATATTATTVNLKWNSTTNATGYMVTYTAPGNAAQTLSTSVPYATLGSLKPQTTYSISVQATPADAGAGSATATVTTPYGAVGGGQTPVTPGTPLAPGQQIEVNYQLSPQLNATAAANKFGINIAHLQQVNPGLSATATSGVVKIPYLVGKGDTVNSIASKFGISVEDLELQLQNQGID